MAVLKKIKFGTGAATPIAQTVVTAASESVLSVVGTNTGIDDNDNPSYAVDLNIDGKTLVKSTSGEGQQAVTQLAVGTVPAAQVSVADSGDKFTATNVEAALAELKDDIDSTGGAAKSYKIVEVANPASSSLKEYKVQVAVGSGTFADDTNSATIVVPKDQHLKAVEIVGKDGEGHTGTFVKYTYTLADGTDGYIYLDVSSFLQEAEFGDGLTVSGGVVSANLGNGLEFGNEANHKSIKVKIDSTSEKDSENADFLTVGANGVKIQGIKNEIDRKIAALDVTDTAESGKYVSSVSESDGKITVSRADVSKAVLNDYAKGNAPAAGSEAVTAADTVNQAIAKLEHQVDAAKAAASAAHSKVVQATNTGNEHVTVTASQPDASGAVTYTIGESDIASAQALADEISRAQTAEGAIDTAVGLTKASGSETRSFTPTTNYGTGSTTVVGNMQALDTALKDVSDKANSIQYKVAGTELTFYGMTEHA